MSRFGIGFVLSWLAICLQVAVCALAGRFCFPPTAAGAAAADQCPSVCCDERVADAVADAFPSAVAPLLPSNSDCCLELHAEIMAPMLDSSSIRVTVDAVPKALAAVECLPTAEALGCGRLGQIALAAIPPPTLGIVQTTTLQI